MNKHTYLPTAAWNGGFGRMPKRETVDAAPIMERYRRLLGSQRQVALTLGVSERWVSDLSRGAIRGPMWLGHLIEFMERLPAKDWPKGVRYD